MPNPRRVERLQQLILETVATTVQRDLADPRLGFITITRVRLAPDLSLATAFWSCLGTESEHRTCERALDSARARVQSVVAGTLGTRVTPVLRFQFDDSLEKAARLEGIFEQLRHQRGDDAAAASPEDAEAVGADEAEGARGVEAAENEGAPPLAPPAAPSRGADPREADDDAE